MTLHLHDDGNVRVLRIDRPDRLNALDLEHYELLADAFLAASADPAVRVVVVTGTGRAFCAGADLKALKEGGATTGIQFERMLDALESDTPVLAAVNGLAVGVGTTMLLHCDLVVADPDARFRTPFAALGTAPEAGSSVLLPRITGRQFANLMLLTGDWVTAEQALAAGLVAQLSAPGDSLGATLALARRIAEHPPAAMAATRRLAKHDLSADTRAARRRENEEAARLGTDGLLHYFD